MRGRVLSKSFIFYRLAMICKVFSLDFLPPGITMKSSGDPFWPDKEN